MTKDQMVADLNSSITVQLWSGVVLGSMAIGILGYAVVWFFTHQHHWNWNKWKEWRQQRKQNPYSRDEAGLEGAADDENGDIPDGELWVICLMRMRRSAFIPCGHLVCCQSGASSVERHLSPKCPVCRQSIRGLVRIWLK